MFDIRPIDLRENLPQIGNLIRRSFATVADEFGLTPQNCRYHPAFVDDDATLAKLGKPGTLCFGGYVDGELLGFMAIVPRRWRAYEGLRLAVAPEARQQGLGRALLDKCVETAREQGARKLKAGVIDQNEPLKQWYARYGFRETGKKEWPSIVISYIEMRL